jgi:RNA polymerase-binding transcription factor DksA
MDRDQIRRRLEEERARLLAMEDGLRDQHGVGASEAAGTGELTTYDQHEADMATETFEREKDESILERASSELEDIDRALSKLEDGTYGTCEACGRSIGEDRLEAFPAARFCVEDQAGAEATSTGH